MPLICYPGNTSKAKTAGAISTAAISAVSCPVKGTQEEIRDWYRRTQLKSVSAPIAASAIFALLITFFFFVPHCTWVNSGACIGIGAVPNLTIVCVCVQQMTAMMYSSPQVVLSAKAGDGSLVIFDDFRESYQWLRHNTDENAKILSWWDYGYQITGMGNRTVIVDNNTRNNTHIATVGLVMASNEERAIEVIRALDVCIGKRNDHNDGIGE